VRQAGKIVRIAGKAARAVGKEEKKNKNQGTLDRQAQGNMTTPCGIGIVKEDCSKDPGPRQPESERNGAAAQK